MPLTATVIPGFNPVDGVPIHTDDFRALGRPSVLLEGLVGSSDLGPSAVQPANLAPGAYFHVTATGSVNAYAVAMNPPVTSWVTGLRGSFKAHLANTGPATVSPNGLAAKALIQRPSVPLVGGEISVGQIVEWIYDGTDCQILSPLALASITYAGTDTGAANAIVVNVPGISVTNLAQLLGKMLVVKVAAANTGPTTLAFNGLPATAVTKQGTTALSAGDLQTGGLLSVVYDGTRYQIASFVAAPALPSIGASGTQTYPYSFTVDAQGRVTNKSGGVYSSVVAVPAAGANAPFTHGLSRTPAFVRVVLVMGASTEGGYAESDEVDVDSLFDGDGGPMFAVSANSTIVNVVRQNHGANYVPHKTNASPVAITAVSWTLKVVAW